MLLLGGIAATVLADGIPTPLPQASTGPSPAALQAIAEEHGLTCRADAGAVAGIAETFCNMAAPAGGIGSSATYSSFTADAAAPVLVLVATAGGSGDDVTAARDFLAALGAPFCDPATVASLPGWIDASVAAAEPGSPTEFSDARCKLDLFAGQSVTAGGDPVTFMSLTAWSQPPGSGATPVTGPVATPTPAAGGLPGPQPPGAEPDLRAHEAFARSIQTPGHLATGAPVILESALLALLIVFLMPFPAQLFNSTLEAHYDEVRGWFGLRQLSAAAGRLAGFWGTPVGLLAFILISAALYGLLDPSFGLDAGSMAEAAGMGIGIVVTALVFALPALVLHRRARQAWQLRALPGTLVVGAVCVLASRLTGFHPGYLYGLVLGIVFAGDLSEADEGRQTAISALVMLLAAGLSWLGLSFIGDASLGLAGVVLETLLAAIMVAGLEGVVFGLLPLRFLPGEPLYAWNRIAWGVLLGIGAFAFFHVLINPTSGYLSDSSRTPLFTILGLFLAFGLVSVVFWGYFRFRPPRPEVEVAS